MYLLIVPVLIVAPLLAAAGLVAVSRGRRGRVPSGGAVLWELAVCAGLVAYAWTARTGGLLAIAGALGAAAGVVAATRDLLLWRVGADRTVPRTRRAALPEPLRRDEEHNND